MRFTNLLRALGALALLLVLNNTALAQGVTTGSINGQITDENGEPLIGANVLAVHTPSGTTYGNSTNVNGLYRIPNMRIGGPYTVKVSYTGYEEQTKEGIYIRLGQVYGFNAELTDTALELEGVEVIGLRNDVFDGNKTGAETTVTEEVINSLPTVSRSLADYTRLTPQGTAIEGSDGFSLSFAGQNNRYNAIYIDGAVNNDVFGLSGSGTNGGQTGVQPIALDALEELQISIAPFDVRVAGFAGAAISAVTRSGTNNVEASAYTYYRDENLVRDDLEGAAITPFTAQTSGFRIGGPIIKDKLFYFINAEIQRETTPLPFDPDDYIGDSSIDEINGLANTLESEFGYDPGTFVNNERFLNSDKVNIKFDYALNSSNKFSFRFGWVRADNLEGVQSDFNDIRFLNSSERFLSNTYSGTFEWNSIINQSLSNNLTVGFTRVEDDRDPNGEPFPYVDIQDGSADIVFGSERFSTANLLNQSVLTVNDNFSIYAGNHSITLGTQLEFYDIENLFIPFNYGWYQFDSVDDFLQGENSSFYLRSYSQVDNVIGDESNAIAAFNAGQIGFYAQDEIQVSRDFKVTVGLRFDQPFYDNTPVNESFDNEVLPQLADFYDTRGAQTGQFIDERLQFSPRLGFNWDVGGGQKTQIRGGIGIFTSRAPLVWVGGAYNNYGFNRGEFFSPSQPFESNVNKQAPGEVNLEDPTPSGDVDLFAANLQLPQFLKSNLVLDQRLPGGFVASLDMLYTRTLSNVAYQDINLRPAVGSLSGTPDNRLTYDQDDRINDTYEQVLLGYNVNDGYSYNITAELKKNFSRNLFATVAYSYGDSYTIFDGTSSQNSSQWRGLYSVNGRNIDQVLYRSTFAQGSRVISGLSLQLPYDISENLLGKTTISMFYEGLQGRPYSYIYNDRGRLTNEDSRERELIYIPENRNDIVLVEDNDLTPDQQWALLDRFIDEDSYLSQNRGRFAERNSNFGPWSNIIDLRFLQDFTFVSSNGKQHTLQLSLDISNFTNLLNEAWGRRELLGSSVQILNFEGFQEDPVTGEDTTVPTFSFDPDNITRQYEPMPFLDDRGIQSSRWQMNIGVRYIFE